MQQGRFSFKNNLDKSALSNPLICWVSPTGMESSPLTGLHAISGEFFPLVPHPIKPYFKPEDGGLNGIYGRWINTSDIGSKIVNTGHITLVTTVRGDEISTLLALTHGATASDIKTVTPQEFAKYFIALVRGALLKEPEHDVPGEPAQPVNASLKVQPPNKPGPV